MPRGSVARGEATPFALNPETEVAYLFANGVRLARLAYEAPGDVPSVGGETLHVFFELGDHLGSTSVVLDKATGELVERSTYQAYGGSESDYRPERWKHFREDYRFTGKEEDVEVGLIYFGKRFLNPLLNRWVSADPLAVHGLGADPNLYAYVSGKVLQSVDPLGLEGEDKKRGKGGDLGRVYGDEGSFQRDYKNRGGGSPPPPRAKPKQAPKTAKPKAGVPGNVDGGVPGGTSPTPPAPIAEGKGGCKGPACGFNDGHGGDIKETDGGDAASVAAGIIADQEGPEAGGKVNGSPGGGCEDCLASKFQQWVVTTVRAVRVVLEAFGAKIASLGAKLLGKVAGQFDDIIRLMKGAAHAPNGPNVHAGVGGGLGGGIPGKAKVSIGGQQWKKFEPGSIGCENGCEDAAKAIKGAIGGETKVIRGANGAPALGRVRNSRGQLVNPAGSKGAGWAEHHVVVKDGRVYDALTGPAGMPIDQYKGLWEYSDAIDFGF